MLYFEHIKTVLCFLGLARHPRGSLDLFHFVDTLKQTFEIEWRARGTSKGYEAQLRHLLDSQTHEC